MARWHEHGSRNGAKWIKGEFKILVLCGGIHATLNPEEVINVKEIKEVPGKYGFIKAVLFDDGKFK